ncbi:MAG: TenA family protein [Pseudotabrizicola sp.]|uniref:TenA family protein n=1 Tax=Pseudotabrizicola sp. TaxID=2939647 RepID=UPI002717A2E9|nr:TenA family protein [Pseudotabrizicola sp.]MDO9638394.1 TenA family protein [Pseudotabrizicola sp.]
MRPTDHLKSLCAADWTAATRHAFTDALAQGTLPAAQMLGYLRQDYLFVEDFTRLLGAMIAHAPSLADAVPAGQFMGLICGPENTYFQRAIAALGGDPAHPAPPHPVTTGFQTLMREAARSGRYEQMLAVLVVAEWSYLDWASPHAAKAPTLPFWFGDWIDLHAGPGFEGFVAYLRAQLDTVWPKLTAAQQRAVEERFIEAARLERGFFDAALAGFESR